MPINVPAKAPKLMETASFKPMDLKKYKTQMTSKMKKKYRKYVLFVFIYAR